MAWQEVIPAVVIILLIWNNDTAREAIISGITTVVDWVESGVNR